MVSNKPADFDTRVKVTVYQLTAATGAIPSADAVAEKVAVSKEAVKEAYARLQASRLLLLERNGETIRMAPPFSGVATQHKVKVGNITYNANCAWDALGVVAALHRAGLVESRCAQSGEPLRLCVEVAGPTPSRWLFHCLVPAAKWWDDLVFT